MCNYVNLFLKKLNKISFDVLNEFLFDSNTGKKFKLLRQKNHPRLTDGFIYKISC